MRKRIVAILLSVFMLLSAIPAVSFAADETAIRYEAEASGNVFTGSGPYAIAGASGDIAVGGLGPDGAGSFVMNNILVPEDGEYRVDIYYGSDGGRTFRLNINDETDLFITDFPSTGGCQTFLPKTIRLPLKKGLNSIKFYALARSENRGDSQWMPDFDCIDVFANPLAGDWDVNLGGMIGEYHAQESEVTLNAENGKLKIRFYKEDMIRVRMAAGEEEFLSNGSESKMLEKVDYAPVPLQINDAGSYIRIASSQVVVRVDKETLALQYYNADETELITRNAAAAPMTYSSVDASKTVRFERDAAGEEEHFYGLGSGGEGDFTTFDWRDLTFRLWLSDKNKHAITPLYYSTAGYGIYLNNAWDGMCSFLAEDYSIKVEGGELDYFFFFGPSFQEILSNFSELTGRMQMPPRYSLGLTYRGKGEWNEEQLIEAITTLQKAGIPVDTVGVEPGWQTATYPCTYVWSSKFPDPGRFVERMHELGVRVNLWEHPYIHSNSPIYEAMLPYSLKGNTLPNPEHAGAYYGFGGLIPDLTIPAAQEIYWGIHKTNLADIGVDGYKVDETDSWSSPADPSLQFPSGIYSTEYHNLLGTTTVNLMHEKYREDLNQRCFIFSRGNYTGMQKYATTAYTDYFGFDQFLRTVVTQGFSGTYFTPELRGVSESSNVLYQRRAQMMFLTPFPMSNEWVDGELPTDRPASVVENYRKYDLLHYALIPYMYSYFWNQHHTGLGVVRPMVMEYQQDENTYAIDNQFFLGEEILVAPVNSAKRNATVSVYLPKGDNWVDYNTGYVYQGGQTITFESNASDMPIYIREGSIIPMAGEMINTEDNSDPNVYLDIYPSTKEAEFLLYEDDGISYNYEKGAYCETNYRAVLRENLLNVQIGKRTSPENAELSYQPVKRDYVLQLHYRAKPNSVTMDSKPVAEAATMEELNASEQPVWYYQDSENDSEKIVYLRFVDDGDAHTIQADVPEQPEQPDLPPIVVPERDVFECEAETSVLNGAGRLEMASASGGLVVNSVGNDGRSSFTMNGLTVAEDGKYTVEIAYLNGDALRKCMISVNDGAPIELCLYSTGGFSVVGTVSIDLILKKGENSIKFYTLPGEGWAPDFDCVYIYKDLVIDKPDMEGATYGVEDFLLKGNVTLAENTYASVQQAAANFVTENDRVKIEGIEVKNGGPYQFEVTYSNAESDDMALLYSVNGGKANTLWLPPTVSRNIFQKAQATIYLEQGTNSVEFYMENNTEEKVKVELDQVTLGIPTSKIVVDAPESVIQNEAFQVTIQTPSDYQKLILLNENDRKVSFTTVSKSFNDDGSVSTVIELWVGTQGAGRVLRVYDGDTHLGDFTFDVEPVPTQIFSVVAPASAEAGEVFQVTVTTTDDLIKHQFYNEYGRGVGRTRISKLFMDGKCIATYELMVATPGENRTFILKADFDKRNDYPYSKEFTMDII